MDYIAISPQDELKTGAIIAVETSGETLKAGDSLKILFTAPTQKARIELPASVAEAGSTGASGASVKIRTIVEKHDATGLTKIGYGECRLTRCPVGAHAFDQRFPKAEYWEVASL